MLKLGLLLDPKNWGRVAVASTAADPCNNPKRQDDKCKRFVLQKQYAYLLCFIFERVFGCPVVFFIKDFVVRGDVKGTATHNTIDE